MQLQSTPGSLLDPLVPPALNEFETPTQFCQQSLTNNTISALLTAPQSLLGRQFVHHMFDIPFRITEVQLSYLHGTQFLVQYKGTIDSFPLESSDFHEMLTGCDAICPTES